jgi:hypothetical protein
LCEKLLIESSKTIGNGSRVIIELDNLSAVNGPIHPDRSVGTGFIGLTASFKDARSSS